jgi:HD-GYP domain-containing protein (c-di-GMP phosphodiesterase class II)
MRDVEFGALLHDVGKMAVPNEVINKPGKLTAEEWELMKTHTLEGYEMLGKIGGVLAQVGAVVRSHHERYDGSGYPDGLAGSEIPIASRVITVCDSFNAMTTHRSYSAAMTIPEAVAELRREAGRQFDPVVVEALIEIVATWGELAAPSPRFELSATPLQPA